MTGSGSIGPVARHAADWLRQQLPAQGRLRSDSRRVAAGDAFFAYPGEQGDGRDWLRPALDAGAAAIVVERAGLEAFAEVVANARVPSLVVEGLRRQAGEIASAYLGEPSARVKVIAVTGTNGKTSCTHWIAQGFDRRARRIAAARSGSAGNGAATSMDPAHARAAVVGTLGAGVPAGGEADDFVPEADADTVLTTPDALGLQHRLADFAARGIELVALEASSIGLQQGRLNGTRIAVAVLTNLSRDHLDYHVTMQAYAAAKARLFAWPTLDAMVVNLGDPASTEMLNAADPDLRRIGYLLLDAPAGDDALVEAGERSTACSDLLTATPLDGQGRILLSWFRAAGEARASDRRDATGGGDSVDLQLALIGRFNVANALAVAGTWLALGWSLNEIAAGLESLRPVPGRLQMVGDPHDDHQPLAVVDYAHTPDALANALDALRPLADERNGRLWCVFGAGSDRDAGKRAPMAAAAERHADEIVLTSDNPRGEAPEAIIAQLRAGLSRAPWREQPDRAQAIAAALQAAAPADVVLIAGKGHEPYQEIRGRRLPFSDVDQARLALRLRAEGGGDV
ncbi:MAG: UDP-N-acetylmuramoyl-L-alanyl-D-glutamate--2,6-diaminopimelate ligase [Burkholderiaceae bacterium]|nr:UDP-N-acetylmuramoyl-L-alanyl-D-glutamate--2,6-diaminopimelate ligase [Burkholderiaceae bacterium]